MVEAPSPSLQDLLRGAGVSSLLGSVLWKVNALAHFKPEAPINSICQLNRGPGALSGALSGASHPSKCLVREMASVESCVPNLFMPQVRCREGAGDIKQISFADVMHWSHITAFKTDESVGLSPAKQNGERNYYRCALYSIQCSLKSISFAEMLTDSAGRDRLPQSLWLNTARHPEGSELRSQHGSQAHNVHRGAPVREALQYNEIWKHKKKVLIFSPTDDTAVRTGE